jgi:hypothetical protein
MEPQEAVMYLIHNFVGTIVAIMVVAGIITKIKPVGVALKRFCFGELYDANEKQDKRLDNLELYQLKQILCDRRFPDSERLNAGEEYIKRGGNGEVKMRYEALKQYCEQKIMRDRERAEQQQAAGERP